MSLAELLDRPIAFQRSFVRLGCGITGALLLSQAIYWSNRTKDEDGWFFKSQSEWEDETGLTRYEQEGARAKLMKAGILQEKREGIPAKLFYRVDMRILRAHLLGEIPQTREVVDPKQDVGLVPHSEGEKSQSIYTETTAETTPEITPENPIDAPTGGAEPEECDGPKDRSALTYAIWHAYSRAFMRRYRSWPKWNKAVAGMLAQVVSRLGKDDAPQVAEFYLGVGSSFYTSRMHHVSMLLRDCESLYAQWSSGSVMTATRARHEDRRAAARSTADEAFEMAMALQGGRHAQH